MTTMNPARGLVRIGPILGALLLAASATPAEAEMGFYGWGPRLGVGESPDQILVGIHQDFGEFVDRVRFQPSLDLGFGDDQTVVSLTIPVHYRFPVRSEATPYVGGGLRVAWIDRDLPPRARGDDSEVEFSPVLLGGVEWELAGGSGVLLELHLAGGDAHEAKIVFGWMMRAR